MDRKIWVFLYTLTLLHVARFIHCVEASICYDQDGTPNSNTPCTTDGNDTFCCSYGYFCLSNGLCEWQDGTFWAGTCSDKTWSASSCPTFCDDSGGPAVFECSTFSGTFCCGLSACCGSKSASILTLGRVSTVGYITKGVLTPMTPIATTTAFSSTSIALSTETSLIHDGSSTALVATATKTQSSTTSIDTPSTKTTTFTSNTGAIVGGIVGGGAVIGTLVVAIWALHARHEKAHGRTSGVEKPQSVTPPPRYYNPKNDWKKMRPRNSEPYELHDGRYE